MKNPYIFLLLLLLFYSCKTKSIDSLQDVLNELSPKEQEKTIDPSTDNMIEGEKGTKVFIPADAFQFKDGSPVTGKVVVTLKECFSVSDFISNNLSTLSRGYLLETGGMILISAASEGKELEISKTKSYIVAFPNKDTSKPMMPFYGAADSLGRINWNPVFSFGESDSSLGGDSTLVDSSMYKPFVIVCTSMWTGYDSEWKLKHADSTINLYVENNFHLHDSSLINLFCQKGFIPRIRIYLNSSGKVDRIDFDSDKDQNEPTGENARNVISDFFKSMPPINVSVMNKASLNYGYRLSLCCHISLDWKEYDKRFKEKYSKYQDKAIEQMGKEAVSYSVLSLSKLGWINCDRFLYDDTEKTDFVVNIEGETGSLAFITFDSTKSIMGGEEKSGGFVFRNMPVNSKIKVIGIAYHDGKPLLSKMPAIISKQPFTLSGLKEFSLNDLEKQLNN
jgi:hypothetical protein